MSATTESRVLLGYVARAHGLRGAIRVRPASGDSAQTAASLARVTHVFVDEQAMKIMRVRPDKEDLLLELEGLADRDRAEAMRGRSLFVPRDALPPPDEDELYLADLVGCEVFDASQQRIGKVTGSYDSGGQDVLIVDANGREVLLPFVEPMLVDVDLDARRIVYDVPEGLIE